MKKSVGTVRVAAVAAAAALTVMGLAACGDESKSADQSGSAATDEAVEITYLHRLPDGDGMTKVQDIVKKWNDENPNIHVTSVKYDGVAAEMIKKLETDIKADSGPCLAQLGYAEVPEMYVKGLTEDVTQYAEKYKDNYSGAYGMMKVGDTVVGLPQDTGPLVYYYNKDAFEKLGIEVPKDIDSFVETAKKAAGEGKYIADFQADEVPYWMSAQAASAGASWYNVVDDKWKVEADSDKSQVVAKFWQQLLDDKSVDTQERWSDAFTKALVDGTLIGHIGAAWEAPLLMDSMEGTDNAGKWQVTQIPDFGAGALTGPDGGSGVAVMKGCKAPEQAMEFNNWFNTQINDLATQGLVVAAKGTTTTPENLKEFYGGQDVFAELAKANENLSADFAYMPFFSAVADPMKTAAAAALDGSGTVADIFKAAQDGSVKALEDGGLPVAK